MWKRLMVAVIAASAAGCAVEVPVEPAADAAVMKQGAAGMAGAARLSVMTRNLYVGANVDAVIAALLSEDTEQILSAFVTAYGELVRTDFPSRAEAIADEIAAERPQVVGLQELTKLTIDLTLLHQLGYLPAPITYAIDFEPLLTAALAARGLDYQLVTVKNIDIDVAPIPGTTVHLEDWDGMLIRGDLTPSAISSDNYEACLGPSPCLGGPLLIRRGWIRATIPIGSTPVSFVTTHLESGNGLDVSYVRALQVIELMTVLGAGSPLVLMGDLNEEEDVDLVPEVPGVYEVLMGAGFTDLWRAMRPGADGLTCCHLPDLSDRVPSGFDQRIDYVLARGFGRTGPGLQGKISIVGKVPADRLSGPLGMIWPSDHAGLAASLLFPPAWAGTR